jgi:hypothetical protein
MVAHKEVGKIGTILSDFIKRDRGNSYHGGAILLL